MDANSVKHIFVMIITHARHCPIKYIKLLFIEYVLTRSSLIKIISICNPYAAIVAAAFHFYWIFT